MRHQRKTPLQPATTQVKNGAFIVCVFLRVVGRVNCLTGGLYARMAMRVKS